MSKSEKVKDEWGCKWLLTLNAPTLTKLITTTTLADMPVEVLAAKMAVEIGENGNLHKHLYVVFCRSWRRNALINRFKGTDVKRVTSGTEQTVISYIGNPEKEIEKGCIVLHEYDFSFGNLNETQGQRNDISASDSVLWQIKDAIDSGASIHDVWQDFFPYMIRYGKGIVEYKNHLYRRRDREETKETPEPERIQLEASTEEPS